MSTPEDERTSDDVPGPPQFTPQHRAALELRQADQDRTLAAVHALEAALGAASPGREGTWRDNVRTALAALRIATAEEERTAGEADSLLSDIARTQPRLRTRVRGLRVHYQQVRDTIESLGDEFGDPQTDIDVADLRQRLAWLLGQLRYQRARESDLIYEAYYEAFRRDVEQDRGEVT